MSATPSGVQPPAVLSPSGIKLWYEGKRKWAWRYIARKPRKSSASADLGTAVHGQLERHLRGEGFDFSTAYLKKAAEIALLGVPLLPPPLSPGMRVENRLIGAPPASERDFRFESLGVVYRGRMDVTVPDSIVVPGLLGGAPAVVDHKTSSNIAESSLSEEDLHTDTQGVVYAYYLMGLYQRSVADLQWNYLPTRGAAVAVPRRLRVYSSRVVDEFGRIQETAADIASALRVIQNPLSFPPCNEHAGTGVRGKDPCLAYGGCPFKEHCTDVFDRLGFPIPRTHGVTIMNGTQVGHALMQTLAAEAAPAPPAAPDPYIAYAAWRATVPSAPSAPGYEALEARYLAASAPPPAPPPPVVEALPTWATSTTPYAGAAPAAINPPEFQAPPTLEQRAAVLAPETKAKRPRRTKAEMLAAKAAGGETSGDLGEIYSQIAELFARASELV